MATLPAYDAIWNVYPDYVNYPDPQDVKDMIGGAVNADWITNTCAIRMSRALNYIGVSVPVHFKGMSTVKGGDGKRYAFRVREMRKWLDVTLSKADFDVNKIAGSAFDKASIASLQGIIVFDIAFADATGHMDLWDGSTITSELHMSRNYYDAATRIVVWKSG